MGVSDVLIYALLTSADSILSTVVTRRASFAASLATRSLILWISSAASGVKGVGVPSASLVVTAGGISGVRSPVSDRTLRLLFV